MPLLRWSNFQFIFWIVKRIRHATKKRPQFYTIYSDKNPQVWWVIAFILTVFRLKRRTICYPVPLSISWWIVLSVCFHLSYEGKKVDASWVKQSLLCVGSSHIYKVVVLVINGFCEWAYDFQNCMEKMHWIKSYASH